MTNIEKIRQEIERLLNEYKPVVAGVDELTGAHIILAKLLSFIDSLPEEKPSDDLEEAAEEYAYRGIPDEMKQYVKPVGDEIIKNFIAGAKWQAKQLLKGSPLPEDTVLFQKGVEEGKRLMMEDAEDGEIGYWSQSGLSIRLDQYLDKLGYDKDTKVKIIIVKQ